VLVNNAGVEACAAYHDLSEKQIKDILTVNLEAPMMLTRAVLPEMCCARGRGHYREHVVAGRQIRVRFA